MKSGHLQNLKEVDHPGGTGHVLCAEYVVEWSTATCCENIGRRAKLCPNICREMNGVKPRNTSISTASVWNEIQTEHLPNKNLAPTSPNIFWQMATNITPGRLARHKCSSYNKVYLTS
jgi:hypothetical protein